MKHLVIGLGEVGTAIQKVFNCAGHDKGVFIPHSDFDIIHICIPFSSEFVKAVENFQSLYESPFTIIHSTVPVGTSRKLNALHSPIRGLHPNLYEGIMTFEKFLGGEQASQVADEFRKHGMKVILCDKQEDTEALKLFDTQYYLECVRFVQRVKKYCNEHNLDFHAVYSLANKSYNEGYTKLGHSEYVRPVLQPIMKEVGGHCLLPNEKLLDG